MIAAALVLALALPTGDVFDLAHPAVRVFSDRDGLPQNTINVIGRDGHGYLWVGTQDGAARFNGRSWTAVDMKDREVSNYVRTLVAARDGSLWFGRESGGVVRLRDGEQTVFARSEGLPADRVNRLFEAKDGTIWAATLGGGAARFDGTRFVAVVRGLRDLRLWVVKEVDDDAGGTQLLAGGEGGLARLEADRWVPLDLDGGRPLGSINAIEQAAGPVPRALWIGTYGEGVLRWRAGHITRFGPAEGLASRLVTSLALTPRAGGGEGVWVGTRDAALFHLEGERFVAAPLGVAVTEIYSLRAGGDDDPGALWVGTRTSGLLRLEAASWFALDRSSGLPTDQVLGLLETKDAAGQSVYWVGTGAGLAVVRGNRLSIEGATSGLPGPQVLALAELRDHRRPPEIWASIVGLGLVRRVGERWARVDARPAFNADHGAWLLATMTPQGAGVLWVGTERSGLARMEGGRWTVITTAQGLPANHVVSLLETESAGVRSLWVGTRGGGLALIVAGRVVTSWNRASGLPNDDAMSLAEVRLPDGRHELWVGTRAGVVRRALGALGADGPWHRLSDLSGPPLESETVLSIQQDRSGRIYLGTQRGVVRLTQSSAGAGATFDTEVFGLEDGLPSATANWGRLLDSRGRIWIATTGGVALFDPGREAGFKAPHAALVLEQAVVTTTGRRLAPAAVLGPREHDLSFEYALLTPRRAGSALYRVQLIGYDEALSGWTTAYQKAYTNLPAGRYLFHVEAQDAGGLAAAAPAELPFRIRASPWLEPWAILLEFLAVLGGGYLVVRLRESALHRRAGELSLLVAERTRLLREANERLATLSVTDPLTGLPNRRRLESHVEAEWRGRARRGEGIAFVMVDVDHFKDYNDALGHLVGDECLAQVAGALSRLAQRPGDLVSRYGGEEFACLLVDLDREQAIAHAERLRSAVEGLGRPHPSAPDARVTISLGVAWTVPQSGADWRQTLAAADEALYRAKANGRNRSEVAS